MILGVCAVEGCGGKIYHRGCCTKHYQRLMRNGDPTVRKHAGFHFGDKNPSKRPEHREKMSKLMRGRVMSDEQKIKISQSMKKALRNPALRQHWRDKQIGRKLTPETIQKIKTTKSKRPKKMSTLLHEADSAFSRYIRTKYMGHDGLVECWSCHRFLPFDEMDCGHFVSRQHKSTRYMEENAHPQCRKCNRFMEGHKDAYAVSLIKAYGPDILERLQLEKNKIVHMGAAELTEIAESYKARLAGVV